MTQDEFKDLKQGDIIRHKGGSESYVVTGNYLTRVTAVRSVDLTNPDEWDVIEIRKIPYDPADWKLVIGNE